jgi:alkaline phosphatase D
VAAIQYAATSKASEDVMGADQESWFLGTMEGSTRTWKVWGNEYCLTPLQVDLRGFDTLPEAFQRQFYMSCDSWDGFRNKRSDLIARLSALPNVVAITGDVHAFFAATPMVNDDPTKKIVEFVTSSISSGTFKDLLGSQVAADPVLSSIPMASALAAAIDSLLLSKAPPSNPHLGFAESTKHGAAVFELTAEEVIVTYHQIASKHAAEDFTGREGELEVEKARFRTVAGEHDLYMEIDGAWKRWDPTTLTYV